MSTDTVSVPQTSNTNKKKLSVDIKSLDQKAIRIKLTIGSYAGSKKDKKVSKEVARDHNADEKRTSLQKKLLKSDQLNQVNSLAAEMRNFFYAKTVAWNYDGEGVVPMKYYLKVKAQLEDKKRAFEEAVDKLVAAYDTIKENDKKPESEGGLGDLYNDADYPSKESFRSRFYVDIKVLPLQKDDFRCNSLEDSEIDRINEEIRQEGEKAVKSAQLELLNRIAERLNNLRSRLADKDGKFHASNFTNLFETLDDVSNLNITEDPMLDKIINELAVNLSVYGDADAIRSNNKRRAEALSETENAINKVTEAMKNFF